MSLLFFSIFRSRTFDMWGNKINSSFSSSVIHFSNHMCISDWCKQYYFKCKIDNSKFALTTIKIWSLVACVSCLDTLNCNIGSIFNHFPVFSSHTNILRIFRHLFNMFGENSWNGAFFLGLKNREKSVAFFVWCYFLSHLSHACVPARKMDAENGKEKERALKISTAHRRMINVGIENSICVCFRCVVVRWQRRRKRNKYTAQFKSPDLRLSTSTSTSI